MLHRLTISNYALINELSVQFNAGLNTVTGETGAGKSIILGALGLILGNRADLSVLKDKSEKCIVEGVFNIANYNFQHFFEENDLDYETQTIFRREITPSGKSRAFINDTPVNLKVMRDLGLQLIDIHSQHQNLELGNHNFQLDLVDTVGDVTNILAEYKVIYSGYRRLQKELDEIKAKAEKANADLDYFQFQFTQLDEAGLQENEQEELEAELEELTHAEEIKASFLKILMLLEDEHFSVLQNVKESRKEIEKISAYVSQAPELAQRLESSFLELKDILHEVETLAEKAEYNPERIEWVSNRLNVIYGLQQKHHVETVKALIELRDFYDHKLNEVVSFEREISGLEEKLKAEHEKLEQKALQLTKARIAAFSDIEKPVIADLLQLGMPKTRFQVIHTPLTDFTPAGRDSVSILFSANADAAPDEISKIASGGEMSRLMLAIKNLLRNSKKLPTVIFDEIDSGVSGEIAVKMGNIIKSFSATTQIINITHLPQIAARGDAHFHVYKFEKNGKTFTSVKQLTANERLEELAKMVGGERFTDSNLQTAQELLNN